MNTPANPRASHWFKTEEDFTRVCADAVSMAKGENAEEFAARIMKSCKRYGLDTFVSEAQLRYLCRLADVVPPLPVNAAE